MQLMGYKSMWRYDYPYGSDIKVEILRRLSVINDKLYWVRGSVEIDAILSQKRMLEWQLSELENNK